MLREVNGHHGLLNPDQVQAIERAAAAIVDDATTRSLKHLAPVAAPR